MVIDMVRLLFLTHDSIFSSLDEEEELLVARLSHQNTPQYCYSLPYLLSAILFRFFTLHIAQLFMHISQIVRKQISGTKRNERNT